MNNKELQTLASLCAAVGILLVAAVFISGGGVSSRTLVAPDVSSGSQTASFLDSITGGVTGWFCNDLGNFSCSGGNNNPVGSFDAADCNTASGWAKDPDNSSEPVTVALYAGDPNQGGSPVANYTASDYRSDVGNTAFNIPIPASIKDGTGHALYVVARNLGGTGGSDTTLSGSPRNIQCGSVTVGAPTGRVYADSSQLNVGQSTTVHLEAHDGANNPVVCTSIDMPVYGQSVTGGVNNCQPFNKTYTFNATTPGYYTFHASLGAQNGTWTDAGQWTVQVIGPNVTTPPPTTYGQPTASISADLPNIQVGQSVGIHATFAAGANDTLTATNIDSPVGTGLASTISPGPKDITFTPTSAGTYTFYARVETANYAWQTKDTVTVTATNAPSCPNGLDIGAYPSCSCPTGQTQQGASCVEPSSPVLSFSANPPSVAYNGQTTLSYSATGGAGYDACELAGGEWGSGVPVGTLGSQPTSPLTSDTQYSYTCHDTYYGWQPWQSVTVSVGAAPPPPPPPAPSPSVGSSCASGVQTGGSCDIHWACPAGATGSYGTFNTGGATSGTYTVNPTSNTTYLVTCQFPLGMYTQSTSSASVNVTVNQPQLSITATPPRVHKGDPTTILWTATNVTAGSCTVSQTGGSTVGSGESGTYSPTINAASEFTLTCATPAGSVSQSVDISVVPTEIEL